MNKQEAKQKLHNLAFVKMKAKPDDLKLADVMQVLNQIDEPQKVVVPKFVAVWLEDCKSRNLSLGQAIETVNSKQQKEVFDWFWDTGFRDNQLQFARAWLDGYEVEKEKLYRVMLSNKQILSKDDEFNTVFFVHDTTDLRAELTRPELEQAGFGWVFDCAGIAVEEAGYFSDWDDELEDELEEL